MRILLCIQYNTITFTDNINNKNIDKSAIVPQCMSSCLATMDIFLQQSCPVVSSIVVAEKRESVKNSENIQDLVQVVANILGIENIRSMNLNVSFDKLGIDSLGYTEIKQILEKEYDIVLSFREIRALTLGTLRDLFKTNEDVFLRNSSMS